MNNLIYGDCDNSTQFIWRISVVKLLSFAHTVGSHSTQPEIEIELFESFTPNTLMKLSYALSHKSNLLENI